MALRQQRNLTGGEAACRTRKTYLAMAPAGKVSDEVRKQLGDIERSAQAQPIQVTPH